MTMAGCDGAERSHAATACSGAAHVAPWHAQFLQRARDDARPPAHIAAQIRARPITPRCSSHDRSALGLMRALRHIAAATAATLKQSESAGPDHAAACAPDVAVVAGRRAAIALAGTSTLVVDGLHRAGATAPERLLAMAERRSPTSGFSRGPY
jgi:hypothetical protein